MAIHPVTSPGLTVGFLMFFHVSGSFSLELIEESDYPVVNEGRQLERLGYPYSEKFPYFSQGAGWSHGLLPCNLKAQGGHDRRIRSRGRPARFYCTNFSHARFIHIYNIYILDDIGSNGFHCTGLQVWLRFRSPPLAQVVESYFC
jgi:hypothetical protein